MRPRGQWRGGGDLTDTLAPHLIGGNCEISSSAHVAARLSVRVQGPGWFSPFTSTHPPLSTLPPPLHVSHTCLCQMSRPGEAGGGKAGQGQWDRGRLGWWGLGGGGGGAACDFTAFLLTSRCPSWSDSSVRALWRRTEWRNVERRHDVLHTLLPLPPRRDCTH